MTAWWSSEAPASGAVSSLTVVRAVTGVEGVVRVEKRVGYDGMGDRGWPTGLWVGDLSAHGKGRQRGDTADQRSA